MMTNQFFLALCGYIKLETRKNGTEPHHFALEAKLYLRAIQSAFPAARELKTARLATQGESVNNMMPTTGIVNAHEGE
jgi:hypothetical protein